ncbi:hypothetical protein C438_00445 [Haloferax denitrificans ATCC 35960]|uniref:Glycosyltransferase RgtA/B/C/D-like domain-containing protein n=2 Tax=Haloferax denitrificans TaxID=35745 RepID=M0JJV5_9EURY|nr:hypothetical protein C438_00445 [Haloferax denitrificans ATCC 35960]
MSAVGRSILFYAPVSAAILLVVFQIIYHDFNQRYSFVVLLQQSAIILLLAWSVNIDHALYFGGTDLLAHRWYTQSLLSAHHVNENLGQYSGFPLFHILVSSLITVINSNSIIDIMFLASGIIYISLPLSVFLFSSKFFGKKISLLASLCSVLFPFYIYYGQYAIPRSIIPIFFIQSIWLWESKERDKHLIGLLYLVAITLFHASSGPFILVTIVGYIGFRLIDVRSRNRAAVSGYAVYTASLLLLVVTHWIFVEISLITSITSLLSTVGATGSTGLSSQATSRLNPLNNFYWAFWIFFGLIGTYFAREYSQKKYGWPLVLFGASLMAVGIPGPLTSIGVFDSLNFDRWGLYSGVFIAISTSVGIIGMFRKTAGAKRALLLVGIGLFIFSQIANPLVASGDPLFGDQKEKHFSKSELNTLRFTLTKSSDPVVVDYLTGRYIRFTEYSQRRYLLQVDATDRGIVCPPMQSKLVIRSEDLKTSGISVRPSVTGEFSYTRGGTTFANFNPDISTWNELEKKSKIYTTGATDVYQTGGSRC